MSVSSVSGHQALPPSPPRHEDKREVQRAERDHRAENKSNEDKKPVAAPAKPLQTVHANGAGKQVNTTA